MADRYRLRAGAADTLRTAAQVHTQLIAVAARRMHDAKRRLDVLCGGAR